MHQVDQETSVEILRNQVREFILARDWDQFHPPKDLAIGLVIEAGELLEHFRFRSNDEIESLLQDEAFQTLLRHELADCLYFVLALANKLDLDLSAALQEKMALSARRYPVEQVRGRNEKYTAYENRQKSERL